MKWTIGQLRKLPVVYHFSFFMDFTDDIETVEDIIDIPEVKVEGTITRINLDLFQLDFHIDAKLVLACAKTLEPVDYQMHLHLLEKHGSENEIEEDDYLIEGNTLDLQAICWSSILINKPIRIIHERADEILAARGIVFVDFDPDVDENNLE